mmetsp:Transcript_4/g.6  ORF Transcript_4/g.6 Transcript_4/m.6 type:complete len:131 (+) Transcript_4:39-431(+)
MIYVLIIPARVFSPNTVLLANFDHPSKHSRRVFSNADCEQKGPDDSRALTDQLDERTCINLECLVITTSEKNARTKAASRWVEWAVGLRVDLQMKQQLGNVPKLGVCVMTTIMRLLNAVRTKVVGTPQTS